MRVFLRLAIDRLLFFLLYGFLFSRFCSSILHIDEVVDVLVVDEDVLTSIIITVAVVRDSLNLFFHGLFFHDLVFHLGYLFVGFFLGFLNIELFCYQLLFLIFFCQTRLFYKHPLSVLELF